MSDAEQPRQTDSGQGYGQLLDSLFHAAFSANSFDALCSILRVGGMSDANWDPFEESRIAFEDYNWILDRTHTERGNISARRVQLLMYCQAVEMTAPHEILANLLACLANKGYSTTPFRDLGRSKKGKPYSWIPPSAKQKFRRIKELANQIGQPSVVI